MIFATMIHDDMLTVYLDGKQHTVEKGEDGRYAAIVSLLRSGKRDQVPDLLKTDTQSAIDYVNIRIGGVVVEQDGDQVRLMGHPVSGKVVQHIKKLHMAGLPTSAILKFLGKLWHNPSYDVRERLFEWLKTHQMPITEDGNFIAYKAVRDDLWDHHTGETFHHYLGATIEMDRRNCDDNPRNTCSAGAHFCSPKYLENGYHGSRIVVLSVDPADVVTFPDDYRSCGKGRACRYQVIHVFSWDASRAHFADRPKTYFCS